MRSKLAQKAARSEALAAQREALAAEMANVRQQMLMQVGHSGRGLGEAGKGKVGRQRADAVQSRTLSVRLLAAISAALLHGCLSLCLGCSFGLITCFRTPPHRRTR